MGIGTAVAVAGVAATAVSAVGSYESAQYQAGVMKQNAKVAQNNATLAASEGSVQQEQQGMRTAQEVGQQTAAIAGSGVSTQSASSQNVISGTRVAGSTDQSMLRLNQAAQVQNYDTQGAQSLASSQATSQAAPLDAFGTILGGASSVGSQWAMYKKFGVNTV